MAFLGKGFSSLLLLVATPFYVHLLGVEAYGLVGFFQSLLILSNLLELGLGTTLSREMASFSLQNVFENEQRQNLLFTIERVYWTLAFLVGILTILAAPLLAKYWFQAEILNVDQLKKSLIFMAFSLAFQMPMYIYSSGLVGLQKQIPLNSINIIASCGRLGGTLFVLCFIRPTITLFFLSQAAASLLHTLLLRSYLWKYVRYDKAKKQFSFSHIRKLWKFSLGVFGIYLTSLILSQSDKIWISKVMPLSTLGYYSIAALLAQGLYTLINPVFSVFYPKFSELFSQKNQNAALADLYHRGCQTLALFLFPFAATISVFSFEVLFLWTKSSFIAQFSAPILFFLALGTALNGAINLPYALQLAFGYYQFSLKQNLIALAFFVPTLALFSHFFGAVGAAACWMLVNLSFALISIPLMHKKLLVNEKRKWILFDFAFPFLLSLTLAALCKLILPEVETTFGRLSKIALVYGITFLFSFLFFRITDDRMAVVNETVADGQE